MNQSIIDTVVSAMTRNGASPLAIAEVVEKLSGGVPMAPEVPAPAPVAAPVVPQQPTRGTGVEAVRNGWFLEQSGQFRLLGVLAEDYQTKSGKVTIKAGTPVWNRATKASDRSRWGQFLAGTSADSRALQTISGKAELTYRRPGEHKGGPESSKATGTKAGPKSPTGSLVSTKTTSKAAGLPEPVRFGEKNWNGGVTSSVVVADKLPKNQFNAMIDAVRGDAEKSPRFGYYTSKSPYAAQAAQEHGINPPTGTEIMFWFRGVARGDLGRVFGLDSDPVA